MHNPNKTEKNTAILPERLNHETVARFCMRLQEIQASQRSKHLFIDAHRLIFIDPLSMTVLFNTIADLKKQKWATYIFNHLDHTGCKLKEPVRFMDDSEFFLLMSGRRLSETSQCRETTLPIKRLLPVDTVAWIHFTAIPWLARKLNAQQNDLVEIQVCIEELFNNIRDHSGVEFSSIFIQYYPRNGGVKICLSDNGIGLIDKIKQTHPEFSEEDAISHALKEGFTTKSSPRNAGMGLFTLTRTVCNNGGQFAIRTGEIHALITPTQESTPRISLLENRPNLQGTAFEITLYSKGIDRNQSDTEDFSWE